MSDSAAGPGDTPRAAPFWPSFRTGYAATLGLATAGFVFGILFGVIALARGLEPWSAILMSATVFAGASQVAALELWQSPLPYLGLFLVVLLVNIRHVLMGVTLHATLSAGRRRPPFGVLYFLTDANWVLTMRETAAANRVAFFAGSGFAMYSFWVAGTALGVIAPTLLDARTLAALGVGGALYVAVLLCLFYRGRSPLALAAPAVSAAVTLLAARWLDASLALLVGVAAAAGVAWLRELARA